MVGDQYLLPMLDGEPLPTGGVDYSLCLSDRLLDEDAIREWASLTSGGHTVAGFDSVTHSTSTLAAQVANVFVRAGPGA